MKSRELNSDDVMSWVAEHLSGGFTPRYGKVRLARELLKEAKRMQKRLGIDVLCEVKRRVGMEDEVIMHRLHAPASRKSSQPASAVPTEGKA